MVSLGELDGPSCWWRGVLSGSEAWRGGGRGRGQGSRWGPEWEWGELRQDTPEPEYPSPCPFRSCPVRRSH
eukprot:5067606-Pyramimonas_sp.AAC.2